MRREARLASRGAAGARCKATLPGIPPPGRDDGGDRKTQHEVRERGLHLIGTVRLGQGQVATLRAAVSRLLSLNRLAGRNSANFGDVPAGIRGGEFMRRHDKQAVAVLAFLFLVSMAIGLHAWF
jgi:hypothetical protein